MPITTGGNQTGQAVSGSIGPTIRGAVAAEGDGSSGATSSIGVIGDNQVGGTQSGDLGGGYQASAATSGAQIGSGTANVQNAPLATNNGSTATVAAQWSAPQGVSVNVSGSADFRSMQIPQVHGGITVNTPWGNFATPPIR